LNTCTTKSGKKKANLSHNPEDCSYTMFLTNIQTGERKRERERERERERARETQTKKNHVI
jgi:hypothetical protein